MKKRYTEEQIIGFLREADAGLPVRELCRNHGFSEPSYYAWNAKFGGMNVSDAQRLNVAADAKLTHCAEVNLTHLGEADGLLAVEVDPGASSGDTSDGPQGRRGAGDRAAAGLLAQHRAPVSA